MFALTKTTSAQAHLKDASCQLVTLIWHGKHMWSEAVLVVGQRLLDVGSSLGVDNNVQHEGDLFRLDVLGRATCQPLAHIGFEALGPLSADACWALWLSSVFPGSPLPCETSPCGALPCGFSCCLPLFSFAWPRVWPHFLASGNGSEQQQRLRVERRARPCDGQRLPFVSLSLSLSRIPCTLSLGLPRDQSHLDSCCQQL